MADTSTDRAPIDLSLEAAPEGTVKPERAFNLSIVVSAVRCTLTYVILPFVTPLIGLAPGVGPTIGITVGTVAIAANVYSLRRFWTTGHRWRRPITVLHVGVIGLLVVLIAVDIRQLVS